MGKYFSFAMPRSGVGAKSRKLDRARVDGFNMGMLCGCAILNDFYDFTDDEMREWFEGCNDLLANIAKRKDSPKYIIAELREMTGVEISFGGEEE